MDRIQWKLTGGVGTELLEKIHQQAKKVLEQVGMFLPDEDLLKKLDGTSGVIRRGDRLLIGDELVEKMLKAIRKPPKAQTDEIKVIITGYEGLTTDLTTGAIRTPTRNDLQDLLKLGDAFGMIGGAPLTPLDVPNDLAEILMFTMGWENSASIAGGPITKIEVAEIIQDMSHAMGKEFGFGMHVISPMKIDTRELKLVLHFHNRDRQLPIWIGTMPMMGATAPLHPITGFIQTVAEVIGGAAIIYLLTGSSNISMHFDLYPFDMRDATFIWNSPEHLTSMLITHEVAAFYGGTPHAKTLTATTPFPDIQAAVQRAAGTIVARLAGFNRFGYAGHLADEVVSGQQMVLDMEIVDYASFFARGFPVTEADLDISEIISVAGSTGNYLDTDNTLLRFREFMWEGKVFSHAQLPQRQSRNMEDILTRAGKAARQKIEQHSFALPQDKKLLLDDLVAKAKKKLGC